MARVIVAGVAAAVAGYVSGGLAAAQTFAFVYGATGFLDPNTKVVGPKLDDTKAPQADYGQAVGHIEGVWRTAGNVIWSSDKYGVDHESSEGKGGPGVDTTTTTYKIDLLIMFSDAQADAARRAFSNGKLFWSKADTADAGTIAASGVTDMWDDFRFYDGNDAQMPDPDYEAAVGAGNAPAYRRRATGFVKGLNLGNSGQLPLLTWEIVSDAIFGYASVNFATFPSAEGIPFISGISAMSANGFPFIYGTDYDSFNGQFQDYIVYTVSSAGVITAGPRYSLPALHGPCAQGNSDETCIVASEKPPLFGSVSYYTFAFTDGSHIQIASDGDNKSKTFSKLGTLIASVGSADADSGDHKVRLYSRATGAFIRRSASLPKYTQSIAMSDDFVYALSFDGLDIYQLDIATLTLQQTFSPPDDGSSRPAIQSAITCDDDGRLVLFDIGWSTGATPHPHSIWSWDGSWLLIADAMNDLYATPNERHAIYARGGVLAMQRWDSSGLAPFREQFYLAVNKVALSPLPLDVVVSRLCARTRQIAPSQIDVTDLASEIVRGMCISQVSAARTSIEMLMKAKLFTAVEAGDKIVFSMRGKASAATIPFVDVGLSAEGTEEPFPRALKSDQEFPRQIIIKYANGLADYRSDAQMGDRLITTSTSVDTSEFALVMTPAEAKKVADVATTDLQVSITTIGPVKPLRKYLKYLPNDIVTLTDKEGNLFRSRIDTVDITDFLPTWSVILDDATSVNSNVGTSDDYDSSELVRPVEDVRFEELDIPILRDADNNLGPYIVVAGGHGAVLYKSSDDSVYTKLATLTTKTLIGTASTTLGDFTGTGFDDINSLTVNFGLGATMSSFTKADAVAGNANNLLVGEEILCACTATFVSDGVYTLSSFLRGLRGTEWAIAGHGADERVVLLQSSGLYKVKDDFVDWNATRYYKGVALSKNISTVTGDSFVDTGVALKPFAPADLCLTNTGVQDLTLTFNRRSRLQSSWVVGEPPLGEATEAYSVDIYSGSTLLRTINTLVPTITYTSAQQAADGVTVATTLRFDVYQLSATVGRGYVASLATFGRRAPLPQITQVTVGGTFAAGAPLYVVMGSTRFNYTSLIGDATLGGIATSLAAIIDAHADYTATAVGAVITITGPVSRTEPVNAGIDAGDNTITFAVTQTAAPITAGHREEFYFGWNYTGGVASFAGATFFMSATRTSDGMNRTYTFTDTSGSLSPHAILPGVHAGLYGAFVASGDRAAFDLDFAADPAGVQSTFYSPLADPAWNLAIFCNDGNANGGVARRGVGVAAIPVARPQITKATLAGTPVTGRTYRVTLGGVNYDYTAGGGDTTMALVAAGLAPVIDAAAAYIASAVGAVITITGAVANVPFTQVATVIVSTVTAAAAITQVAA